MLRTAVIAAICIGIIIVICIGICNCAAIYIWMDLEAAKSGEAALATQLPASFRLTCFRPTATKVRGKLPADVHHRKPSVLPPPHRKPSVLPPPSAALGGALPSSSSAAATTSAAVAAAALIAASSEDDELHSRRRRVAKIERRLAQIGGSPFATMGNDADASSESDGDDNGAASGPGHAILATRSGPRGPGHAVRDSMMLSESELRVFTGDTNRGATKDKPEREIFHSRRLGACSEGSSEGSVGSTDAAASTSAPNDTAAEQPLWSPPHEQYQTTVRV